MKFITEDVLRDIYKKEPFTSYEIQPGARLTPGARQFLQDRQINVFEDGTAMHVGDGVVAMGQGKKTGETVGTPNLLETKKLAAILKTCEAEFLLTASNLLDIDVCLAQDVLELEKKFEDIRFMVVDKEKTFEPIECKECGGMNAANFSCDNGECFAIGAFHMQTEKGKQILILHRLRCQLYEVQVALMEMQCTNKAVMDRVNQIINRISQLICTAFGGTGCQRAV